MSIKSLSPRMHRASRTKRERETSEQRQAHLGAGSAIADARRLRLADEERAERADRIARQRAARFALADQQGDAMTTTKESSAQ
jgi:hypothetical protein